jgi:hypothetical protein
MKKLEYWFQNNILMINVGKKVAISFHTKQNRFPKDLESLLEKWILFTNQNQNFLFFILQKI